MQIQIKDTNITIMVKDMDRSVAFYQLIGFEMKQRWENHYAQLSAPGIVIGLHPVVEGMPANGSGNTSIGFSVDDIAAAQTKLELLSIAVRARDSEGGKIVHFSDPDGTALYFIQPKW